MSGKLTKIYKVNKKTNYPKNPAFGDKTGGHLGMFFRCEGRKFKV